MSFETIAWIIAGITWGSVILFILGIVTVRLIQKGVEKKRGNNHYRLTCGFNCAAGEENENLEENE